MDSPTLQDPWVPVLGQRRKVEVVLAIWVLVSSTMNLFAIGFLGYRWVRPEEPYVINTSAGFGKRGPLPSDYVILVSKGFLDVYFNYNHRTIHDRYERLPFYVNEELASLLTDNKEQRIDYVTTLTVRSELVPPRGSRTFEYEVTPILDEIEGEWIYVVQLSAIRLEAEAGSRQNQTEKLMQIGIALKHNFERSEFNPNGLVVVEFSPEIVEEL